MDQFTKQFNRPTAEVLANHIADSVSDDVNLTDIIVTGTNRGHVIQMEYELNGEAHQRVLRSVNEVESFLSAPLTFTIDSSPETVAPDREIDW
jgi:hypothetical protein